MYLSPVKCRLSYLGFYSVIVLIALGGARLVWADLTPAGTFQGKVGVSIDAIGSNNSPVGSILAQIPVGATIRQAYLYAAGTPHPWYSDSPQTLAHYNSAGISLQGTPITNFSAIVGAVSDRPDIGRWYTGRADVTTVVQGLVALNPLAASHSWTYAEGAALNSKIDGGLLAIVYEEASLADATVVLLDGGQRTGGETTVFSYGAPLGDPTAPDFRMNMSLGISFSCCGQVSQVDVNGQRLTSAAGNADDGLSVTDGALITAGGIGDSNANPANPFSTDPAGDDELYDLRPFLAMGQSNLTISTRNATNDDNIFFMSLYTSEDLDYVPEPALSALAGMAIALSASFVRRRQ